MWRLAFFEVISHLVKDRMDITGARWGLPGAEAILKLRALHSNGDFPEYRHHHLDQEQQRIHRSRYANSVIPHDQDRRSPDPRGTVPLPTSVAHIHLQRAIRWRREIPPPHQGFPRSDPTPAAAL